MFHGSNGLCKARTHRRCVRAVFFRCCFAAVAGVKNKYIPLILGGISMVLCAVWVMATSEIETAKEGAMAVFTAVTQGILVAGLSNYVNQIIKQIHKPE